MRPKHPPEPNQARARGAPNAFMGRAHPWVLLLLVAGASAEECAAKAGSADGSGAPAEGCGCSSLKRNAALEQTRNGEESSMGEKAPAAVEGAPADQGAAAARAGGDASAGTPAELLWIPGGEFVMGHNDASVSPSTFAVDGEGPARRVAVSGVWMRERTCWHPGQQPTPASMADEGRWHLSPVTLFLIQISSVGPWPVP